VSAARSASLHQFSIDAVAQNISHGLLKRIVVEISVLAARACLTKVSGVMPEA